MRSPLIFLCALVGALAATGALLLVHAQAGSTADDKAAIEALEKQYNYGVNSRDVNLIMACYAPGKGLFVFDDGPPREHPSWESYKKDWEEFLSAYPGPVTNVVSEQSITVVGAVAYGHNIQMQAFTRKDGTKLNTVVRVTDVYRKLNGNWLIVQEHVSFPVDAETGKADLMSRP